MNDDVPNDLWYDRMQTLDFYLERHGEKDDF